MATKDPTAPETKPAETAEAKTTPTGSKPTKPAPGSGAKSPKKPAKKTGKSKRKKKPVPPEKRPLTAKQLAFCAHYVSAAVNMNGTEAARRAGYKGTDNTVKSVASENLTKPNVRAEIDRRMAVALSGAEITVEAVLRQVQVVGAKALEAGKFSPALRSTELLGKYLKMWTDKIEHVQDVDDMSIDQLMALLVEVTEGGGIDISRLLTEHGSDDGSVPDPAEDPTKH